MKKVLFIFVFLVLSLFNPFRGSAQLLLEDNFGYTVGTALSANGWAVQGAATPLVLVTASSISYTGYLSSGIGDEVTLSNTGEDVNRTFATQTSGTIYASCLVNVTSATTTGEYFFHLGPTPISTTFKGRVFVKRDASNNLAFGISYAGAAATAVWSPFSYSMGTTYLIVLKYTIVSGTGNDVTSIFINPTLNAAEPVSGWITSTDVPVDPANIGTVALRQGSASTAAVLKLDGVRVGNSWSDIVGSAGSTPTITINPTTLSGFTYVQGNGPSGENNFTISGANLSSDISIAPSTNYEISTGTGAGFSATDPIVLTQSGGSVTSTTIYVRLKAGLSTNTYNGETITATSTGATNGTVTCDGSVLSVPTPILTLTPTSLSGFSTVSGTYSASQSYTASADYLVDNVTVTAPANFEISTDNITFSPSIVLLQSGGNITGEPAMVYVRITASATGGAVAGNITHASTNLTQVDLGLTGTVYYVEPSNHASNFQVAAPNYSSVTLTWADNDGIQPATGFLILANTTGVFTPPVDGTAQTSDFILADGSGVANVLHGVQTFTWTGLVGSTHYYFEIYAYTNSGTNINYKLVPAAPAGDVITLVFVEPLAAWTFDATAVAPNTPSSVAANFGVQATTAMFYADGTNGSSNWITATIGNELTAFSGTTLNDPREGANVLAGFAYSPVAGTGMSANGKSMVLKFSMTNYQDPILTFATRGTSTGFNSQLWEWSTDNITYTAFGVNTAVTITSFLTKTLDMSTIDQLDNAATVYLRITFNGATSTSGNNRVDNIVIHATEAPQNKTLHLTAFLEGIYTGAGTMRKAQGYDGSFNIVDQYAGTIADQVIIELHNDVAPYGVAYTFTPVDLNTDGTITISTLDAAITGSYYIAIKHRNSIETWSAIPVDFSGAGPFNYSFASSASQAYGDNQKDMLDGNFAIYCGDVDMDGGVGSPDMGLVDNQSASFGGGYIPEDIDGDGSVGTIDMGLVDNNSSNFVGFIIPNAKKPFIRHNNK